MAGPEWKGLFEWSMKYHDGTKLSELSMDSVDREKMDWLENVLKNYMKDFDDRMKEITQVFDEQENTAASLEEKLALLEELQDIVESVDHAKNLHLIGGLDTLISIVQSSQPKLRQKAAEVIATCIQNNLPVQKWFKESGALPPLMKLVQDDDEVCCLRGWLAISSLIRNYLEGEEDFLSAGGGPILLAAAQGKNEKIKRRALSLLQYLLRGQSHKPLLDSGCVRVAVESLDSQNTDVRHAALEVLVEAAKNTLGNLEIQKVDGLLEKVCEMQKQVSQLPPEDQDVAMEEMQSAKTLIDMLTQHAVPSQSETSGKCTALSVVL